MQSPQHGADVSFRTAYRVSDSERIGVASAHHEPAATCDMAPILDHSRHVIALTDLPGISAESCFAREATRPSSALSARLHKLLRSESDADLSTVPIKQIVATVLMTFADRYASKEELLQVVAGWLNIKHYVARLGSVQVAIKTDLKNHQPTMMLKSIARFLDNEAHELIRATKHIKTLM